MVTCKVNFGNYAVALLVLVILFSGCRTLKDSYNSDPVLREDTKTLQQTGYKAKLLDSPSTVQPKLQMQFNKVKRYKYQSTVKQTKVYREKSLQNPLTFLGANLLGIALEIYGANLYSKGTKDKGATYFGIGAGLHYITFSTGFEEKRVEESTQLEGPPQYRDINTPLENKPVDVFANDHKQAYRTDKQGKAAVPVRDFNVPRFMQNPKDFRFRFRYNDTPFLNSFTLNSALWMQAYGIVSTDEVMLRETASSAGDELTTVPGGFNNPVLNQAGSWKAMQFRSYKGWFPADKLSVFYHTPDVSISNCQSGKLAGYTEYFRPKSEFEYQEEYKKRLKKGRTLQAGVIKSCVEQTADELKQKIRDSYEQITLSPDDLGEYKLKQSIYPIVVNGRTYRVEMNREAARQLKQNKAATVIKADRQLKKNGDEYAIFNMQLVHPVTGKSYAIGPQRKPLYLDYTAKGSAGLKGIPKPQVTDLAFREPSGNNKLDANETATLVLTVENKGDGRAQNIGANLSIDDIDGISYQEKRYLAQLEPKETQKLHFTVNAAKDVPQKEVDFRFSFTEANGFPPDGFSYPVSTVSFKAPDLAVYNIIVDEKRNANNNGKIEKAEIIRATVEIINNGVGAARDVNALLKLEDPNIKLINSRRQYALGKMRPGGAKTIRFSFAVNKLYEGPSNLPVQVSLTSEGRKQYGGDFPLRLALHKGNPPQPPEFIPDVDKNIPETGNSRPDAVAVIIGNKDYRETKDVRYALNDAETMKEYLIKVLGYKEANIFVEKNASKGVFETYFGTAASHKGKLFNQLKKGTSEVFVYYAGHGAPETDKQKAYLVPVESNPHYVEQGGYARSLFLQNLAKLPAKRITLVMDACFSGAVLDNISPIVIKTDPMRQFHNGVVFSSSTGEQVSSWYNKKNHSMFTYFFLKALKDTAHSDANSDGKLTYREVYNYVADENNGVPYQARKIHGVEQNPVMQGDAKDEVFLEYK